MLAWFRRAVLRRPVPVVRMSHGTIPGKLWDPARGRWVDEAASYAMTGGTYHLYGPVMMTTDQPLPPGGATR